MNDPATLAAIAACVSAITAILAIPLSLYALCQSRKALKGQQRIVEIEEERERDRRIAGKQADLRASIVETSKSTYRLRVQNQGAASARNLRLEMDGTPFAQHEAAFEDHPLPDLVGAHSEIRCLLGLHNGLLPPFEVRITWDDDSDENRVYETTLTF